MTTENPSSKRRLLTRYTATERKQLMQEHARSGLSKKAFCEERGINLGTFYGWLKRNRTPVEFARIEFTMPTSAPIEVELPNGIQIRVRTEGDVDRTARLIRQVVAPEPPGC